MKNNMFGKFLKVVTLVLAMGALAGCQDKASSAATDKIKIGIIAPLSGPFASTGVEFQRGIDTYIALNGKRVGNHEIELIYRDVGGTNPEIAKRLAEELIVKEKVSMLGGFYISSTGSAVAPVVTQTQTPTVLFVPGARAIMDQSPFFIRAGATLSQQYLPAATWAINKGKKRAYIAVADYAPGHEAQKAFKTKFTSLGGEIIGEDRIPLNTVDFAPIAARIASAKVDVVNIFIPPGAPSVGFLKALAAQGVLAKVTVIGCAETDGPDLLLFDDSILGFYSSLYYSPGLAHKENRVFKEKLEKNFPGALPSYSMVAAYDGMHLLYRMAAAQQGKVFDPKAAMAAVRGFQWMSPRGPVTVEADTREVTQNMYIRRVTKVDGRLENVLVDTIESVKEAGIL
jgi:branched-chain amino acid transport system substrate-binding protein